MLKNLLNNPSFTFDLSWWNIFTQYEGVVIRDTNYFFSEPASLKLTGYGQIISPKISTKNIDPTKPITIGARYAYPSIPTGLNGGILIDFEDVDGKTITADSLEFTDTSGNWAYATKALDSTILQSIWDNIVAIEYSVLMPDIGDVYVDDCELIADVFSPCFIATAAYGTPLAPQLNILRHFRDTKMPQTLTNLYYKTSPPIATFISKHKNLRRLTREIIDLVLKGIKGA